MENEETTTETTPKAAAIFSKGLMSILDNIDVEKEQKKFSGESFQEKRDRFKNMLFSPESGKKYVVRFLVEQEDFQVFKEYNYVPVTFIKNSGERKNSNTSFLEVDGDHPLKHRKTFYKNEKTGEIKEVPVRPRKVLAIPLVVRAVRDSQRGKSIDTPIDQVKIFILPPGKNEANWRTLLGLADDAGGSLKGRNYFITKMGEKKDTAWSVTPDVSATAAEPLDMSEYEIPNIMEVIENCGRWLHPSALGKHIVLREAELNTEEQAEVESYKNVADDL